jgi:hypothetical protein
LRATPRQRPTSRTRCVIYRVVQINTVEKGGKYIVVSTELPIEAGSFDTLVPDPQVWEEFGVTSMTGDRWTKDPGLGFPQPVKIRRRNFRIRRELEEFKARMIKVALAGRSAA